MSKNALLLLKHSTTSDKSISVVDESSVVSIIFGDMNSSRLNKNGCMRSGSGLSPDIHRSESGLAPDFVSTARCCIDS